MLTQTDIQTDTQTYRHRQTDRQTHRPIDRQTDMLKTVTAFVIVSGNHTNCALFYY